MELEYCWFDSFKVIYYYFSFFRLSRPPPFLLPFLLSQEESHLPSMRTYWRCGQVDGTMLCGGSTPDKKNCRSRISPLVPSFICLHLKAQSDHLAANLHLLPINLTFFCFVENSFFPFRPWLLYLKIFSLSAILTCIYIHTYIHIIPVYIMYTYIHVLAAKWSDRAFR